MAIGPRLSPAHNIRLALRPILGLPDDFEAAYIRAAKAVVQQGYRTSEIRPTPANRAHLLLALYPAALQHDPRVRLEMRDSCCLHEPQPARMIAVACGPVELDRPLAEPEWLHDGCSNHRWFHAVQADTLDEKIVGWCSRIADRLDMGGDRDEGDAVGEIIRTERRTRWLGAK